MVESLGMKMDVSDAVEIILDVLWFAIEYLSDHLSTMIMMRQVRFARGF